MNIKNNVKKLLADAGINLSETMEAQMEKYAGLIREWNPFASLVSGKDLDLLESVHIPDSLSLAPIIAAEGQRVIRLLDIGSGGGFPAIPLKIVLPSLQVELVERGAKKVGFLEKVVGSLRLDGIRVTHGNFPETVVGEADIITARAVERPGKLLPQIAAFMKVRSVFLCQMGRPSLDKGFHVEHTEDAWKTLGLRRSELYVVRRLTS